MRTRWVHFHQQKWLRSRERRGQERVLFLGSLALWIGACTFGLPIVRGWANYSFLLSGYTVADAVMAARRTVALRAVNVLNGSGGR